MAAVGDPPDDPDVQNRQITNRTVPRTKVACQRCNSRRVKCNASQTRPCYNCQTRNLSCELVVSKRGKYARSKTRKSISSAPLTETSDLIATTAPLSESEKDAAQSLSQRSLHPELASNEPQNEPPGNGTLTEPERNDLEDEGSEMLFARIAETNPEQHIGRGVEDNGRTFYLGEAFSLAFVVKTVCSPSGSNGQYNVHHPVPASVDNRAQTGFIDPAMETEEMNLLQKKGAFRLPIKHVRDKLITIYFNCFHPAYPVFDRQSFALLYEQGQQSILVLQTVFYIAATICEETLLHEAGFINRHEARTTFYLRAKALYDADYERDKILLTAVLFLLGFWWQGPEDQKDSWHWLGASISLAQTLGMHRSTLRSRLSVAHRSLWKRIWWSIYIRDRHAAAALGRPTRIRDDDCDVEQLDPSDFFEEENTYSGLVGRQRDYHTSYMIEMSKLVVILGHILINEFAPSCPRNANISEALGQNLANWEKQLPSNMTYGPIDQELGAQFWAHMLLTCYNNTRVLLYRPRCVQVSSSEEAKFDSIAREAADNITRIAEDLLSAGTLQQGQLHLVPGLFAALSIHLIVIRRNDAVRSLLAENHARQCMLGLSELSKSWPVGGWILQLFNRLMNRFTGRDFGFGKIGGPRATAEKNFRKIQRDCNDLAVGEPNVAKSSSNSRDQGNTSEGFRLNDENDLQGQQGTDLDSHFLWPFADATLPLDFMFQDHVGAFAPYQYDARGPEQNNFSA